MVAARYCRRPSLVYGLWLLVLVKLLTPPLVRIPVALLGQETTEGPIARLEEPARQSDMRVDGLSKSADRTIGYASLEARKRNNIERTADDPDSASLVQSPTHTETSAALATTAEPVVSVSHADKTNPYKFSVGRVVRGRMGVGCVHFLCNDVGAVVRFRRQVRRPWPTDPNLQQQADMLAKRFGLSRSPAVRIVNATVPPMLWAMLHSPVVFLPRKLVERLTPEQVLTLLAHELAHYRRRDHWVRWLEMLVLGIYWWHPVAWIARRQLQRAEEECCDTRVLQVLPDAAAAYARTILEAVDFLNADHCPSPVFASGLGPVHALERRFEMILHTRPAHRGGLIAKCALLLLALVVLPLSAKAQREPAAIEAAPPFAPANGTPQNILPGTTQAPTTDPVAGAPANQSPLELAGPSPATNPVAGGPAPPTALGAPGVGPEVPAAATYSALPSVGAPTGIASNATEDRLSRLEKMVQSILTDMHGQQHRNIRWVVGNQSGSSNGVGSGTASVSLSDLKKEAHRPRGRNGKPQGPNGQNRRADREAAECAFVRQSSRCVVAGEVTGDVRCPYSSSPDTGDEESLYFVRWQRARHRCGHDLLGARVRIGGYRFANSVCPSWIAFSIPLTVTA